VAARSQQHRHNLQPLPLRLPQRAPLLSAMMPIVAGGGAAVVVADARSRARSAVSAQMPHRVRDDQSARPTLSVVIALPVVSVASAVIAVKEATAAVAVSAALSAHHAKNAPREATATAGVIVANLLRHPRAVPRTHVRRAAVPDAVAKRQLVVLRRRIALRWTSRI